MCAAGYGRMIFLSSVSGLLAHAHHAPYAATKGGLNQLVRVMAREWASRGVTVNAVAPGYIETELTRDYLARPSIREDLVSLVPAGRLGTSDEVADAVTFLASDRAAFITGHILYVRRRPDPDLVGSLRRAAAQQNFPRRFEGRAVVLMTLRTYSALVSTVSRGHGQPAS